MTGKTSLMSPERVDALIATYRDGLLRDTLPFWISHAVDREYGGFLSCLDRDGTVIDTDKSTWVHGRFIWLLSTVYKKVEQRPEWLALARHGIDFLRRYAFDSDGRMFFHLTRDGRPLRKRRYIFAETFAVAGLAAYASAAGDTKARDQAVSLFELITRYLTTPGLLPPKVNPETRSMKGLAIPMIMIVTAQILREAAPDLAICDQWIDRSISEIENHFMKPEFEAVLETVGPNGEFLDHFDGRMLCPGHAIEAAWFILQEAQHRGGPGLPRPGQGDPRLVKLGTTILDWMWERGWDEEYGGLLYYRDVKGLPVHGVLAGHEVLVAAQRGHHRHADGLPDDRGREVRGLAPHGARLGLRPFPRPRIRRVVRLPAPGWPDLDAAEGESVERPVPPAPDAAQVLAGARTDQGRAGKVIRTPGRQAGHTHFGEEIDPSCSENWSSRTEATVDSIRKYRSALKPSGNSSTWQGYLRPEPTGNP